MLATFASLHPPADRGRVSSLVRWRSDAYPAD
jgi:hypothetical protein